MHFTNDVDEIVNIINNDGVVLLQVDTIFGLICNGTSLKAIQQILSIKKRTKPSFGCFVKDITIAKKYALINEKQEELFNSVFPGYFTLILEASQLAKATIPNIALGDIEGKKTIGLRVPKNDFCLEILNHFDIPLIATSANISGQSSPTSFNEISTSIISSVDAYYYDKHQPVAGLHSTIIDITDIENYKIIRNGSGKLK